jgi:hypothetical protein
MLFHKIDSLCAMDIISKEHRITKSNKMLEEMNTEEFFIRQKTFKKVL